MGSIRKRIYLGNLPFDASEEEVTKKFSKFGKVVNVEMKYQSDVSFDVGLPCYAFLDLNISENDLNFCFSKIKAKKWRGNEIKIEIAKESFLSRLERERKNETQSAHLSITSPIKATHFNSELTSKKGNHIKFEDNQEEDNNETAIVEDCNVTQKHKKSKKRRERTESASSLATPEEENVLDKFESFSDVWKDESPQETTCTQKKEKRKKKERNKEGQVDVSISDEISNVERNKIAEGRRLKSLAEREKSVKQQKDAVKLALSSVDSTKRNNRLTFRDEDDEEDEPAVYTKDKVQKNVTDHHSNKKPGLFPDENESDVDADDFSFAIKKQYEGRQGQKLLDLKSKYGNDDRFNLDERFYESDDERDEVSADVSTNDEVQHQLEILKGIVGENLPRGPKKLNSDLQKPGDSFMLRFDPTLAGHRKFELPKDHASKVQANEQKEKNKRKREAEQPVVPVSKTKYYKVTDTLKETLKTSEGGGFSLLQMFGECNNVVESDEDNREKETAKSSAQKQDEESRLSRDNDVDSTSNMKQEKLSDRKEPAPIFSSWGETFFYRPEDPRLYEGIKFFKTQSEDINFSELRIELKEICRRKLESAHKWERETKKDSGNRGFRGAARGRPSNRGSRGAVRGHRGRH